MGQTLIITGIILLLIGLLITVGPKLHLPLLPGDILIRKDNFTFYFPIVTSIVVSIILSIIFGIFRK